MTIEEMIRKIVREELDAYHWRTPVHGDTPDTLHASVKPIVPRYEKRMGCTCPPGAQTSCPDATCPWKPA